MHSLLINARYLDRPMTGVDRVALELISALNKHPEFQRTYKMHLLRGPKPGASPAVWHQVKTALWENLKLGLMKRDLPLVSPCNMGPALRRNHIVFMHDAQVFSQPQSYSKGFRIRYKTLLPILGKTAMCIIAPSEHTKAELQRFGIAPRTKIKVIPNGADHILRTRSNLSILRRNQLEPGSYFLSIGSMAKHKNLEMLARASEARRNRDIPLVIAGGMNTKVFASHGIASSSSIKTLGRVSDSELRALYENATALVFPSKTEGFGLPAAEAMLCGCPVISSTGGAVPEVCGTATIAVDPDDRLGWTSAMERIAYDGALQSRLSRRGRQRAGALTWHAAADQFLTVLEQLPLTRSAKSTGNRIGDVMSGSGQGNSG